MKCQFCNTNESDRIFYTNYMGALYQIPVCEVCLHRMWQQAVAAGQAEDLKRKRQLAVLKIRLQEAANQENYEEAARLRDDIASMEREVCSHES